MNLHIAQNSAGEQFVKLLKPNFRQSIKKIGKLRRFKGEATNFPCVYFLTDEAQNVLYVGKTQNLMQRVCSHQGDKEFSRVYYIVAPLKKLEMEEDNRFKNEILKIKQYDREMQKSRLPRLCLRPPSPQRRDLSFLCDRWMKDTEQKYIKMYYPNYNKCAVKGGFYAEIQNTFNFLQEHKNNLKELAKFV